MELINRNRLSDQNKTTPKPIIFFFFFIFFIIILFIFLPFCSSISFSFTITSAVVPDNSRRCSSAKAAHTNLRQYQAIANCATWAAPPDVAEDVEDQELRLARRGLGGPGSSPPRCASKCGKCTPCTAVHVPVPPGTPVTAEYYPEAWRCKCGNKLYMP